MVPKAWRKRRFKCVDMTSLSTLNIMTPQFLSTANSDFLTSNQLYTAYCSFDLHTASASSTWQTTREVPEKQGNAKDGNGEKEACQ